MCDLHHKNKSTPQEFTDQHFCDAYHKILKHHFSFIFIETKP